MPNTCTHPIISGGWLYMAQRGDRSEPALYETKCRKCGAFAWIHRAALDRMGDTVNLGNVLHTALEACLL